MQSQHQASGTTSPRKTISSPPRSEKNIAGGLSVVVGARAATGMPVTSMPRGSGIHNQAFSSTMMRGRLLEGGPGEMTADSDEWFEDSDSENGGGMRREYGSGGACGSFVADGAGFAGGSFFPLDDSAHTEGAIAQDEHPHEASTASKRGERSPSALQCDRSCWMHTKCGIKILRYCCDLCLFSAVCPSYQGDAFKTPIFGCCADACHSPLLV